MKVNNLNPPKDGGLEDDFSELSIGWFCCMGSAHRNWKWAKLNIYAFRRWLNTPIIIFVNITGCLGIYCFFRQISLACPNLFFGGGKYCNGYHHWWVKFAMLAGLILLFDSGIVQSELFLLVSFQVHQNPQTQPQPQQQQQQQQQQQPPPQHVCVPSKKTQVPQPLKQRTIKTKPTGNHKELMVPNFGSSSGDSGCEGTTRWSTLRD